MRSDELIGLRLRGADRDLQIALDRLHLLADVAGALEDDLGYEVWLRGEPPEIDLGPVAVERLPTPPADPSTGLEDDAPIRVAEDLVVRPPWVAAEPGFPGIELVVPRGGAFGSGEHGSTQAALLAVHELWRPPVESFADVGTGSGILAFYAARRGCPNVMACDIDPAAVAAAERLLPSARVVLGGAGALPEPAAFVVANLTARELAAALEEILAAWTGAEGLVLSGLRDSEVTPVIDRLPRPPDLVRSVGAFTALGLAGQRVR